MGISSRTSYVLKGSFALALVLVGRAVAAEKLGKERICGLEATGVISRVPISQNPDYFIRTLPDEKKVVYHSSHNAIFDLSTGKEVKINGGVDPVPTDDGKYMTFPGLTFYEREKSEKDPAGATSFFTDATLSPSYQSIATLKEEKSKATYRVLAGSSNVLMRDYEVTHASGGNPPTVKPLRVAKELCASHKITLPMLSKDGKRVAGVDNSVTPPVTKVFDIDLDTGDCSEVFSLGFAAGKVDFSYDGKQLAFHVFGNESVNQVFASPSSHWTGNVYVYDIPSSKLRRLTNNTEFNSVFPTWFKDGTLVYLNHARSGAGADKSLFVHVSPDEAHEVPLKSFKRPVTTDVEQHKRWHAVTALGALWSHVCSAHAEKISPTHGALNVTEMGRKECASLVDQYWDSHKDGVTKHLKDWNFGAGSTIAFDAGVLGSLKKEDLLAACPQTERKKAELKGAPAAAAPKIAKDPRVPQNCRDCHALVPFDNLERLRRLKDSKGTPWIDSILDRVAREGEGRMPPLGEKMTKEEQKALETYLRGPAAEPSKAEPAKAPAKGHGP